MKKIINISEAAEFLGVDPDTMRNWDESGKLKAFRTKGGHRRYKLDNLLSMLDINTNILLNCIRNMKINEVFYLPIGINLHIGSTTGPLIRCPHLGMIIKWNDGETMFIGKESANEILKSKILTEKGITVQAL